MSSKKNSTLFASINEEDKENIIEANMACSENILCGRIYSIKDTLIGGVSSPSPVKELGNKVVNFESKTRQEPMGSESLEMFNTPLSTIKCSSNSYESLKGCDSGGALPAVPISDVTKTSLITQYGDSTPSTLTPCQSDSPCDTSLHFSCDDFRDSLSYKVERLLGKKVTLPNNHLSQNSCEIDAFQKNVYDKHKSDAQVFAEQRILSDSSHELYTASRKHSKSDVYEHRDFVHKRLEKSVTSEFMQLPVSIQPPCSSSLSSYVHASQEQLPLHNNSFITTDLQYSSERKSSYKKHVSKEVPLCCTKSDICSNKFEVQKSEPVNSFDLSRIPVSETYLKKQEHMLVHTTCTPNVSFSTEIHEVLHNASTLVLPASKNEGFIVSKSSSHMHPTIDPSAGSRSSLPITETISSLKLDMMTDTQCKSARDEPDGFSAFNDDKTKSFKLGVDNKPVNDNKVSIDCESIETTFSEHEDITSDIKSISASLGPSVFASSPMSCDKVSHNEKNTLDQSVTFSQIAFVDSSKDCLFKEGSECLPPSANTNKYLRLRPVDSSSFYKAMENNVKLGKLPSTFPHCTTSVQSSGLCEFDSKTTCSSDISLLKNSTLHDGAEHSPDFNTAETTFPKPTETDLPNACPLLVLDSALVNSVLCENEGEPPLPAGKLVFMEGSSLEHLFSSNQEESAHIRWYPYNENTDLQDIKHAATQTTYSFLGQESSRWKSSYDSFVRKEANNTDEHSLSDRIQTDDVSFSMLDVKNYVFKSKPPEISKAIVSERHTSNYHLPGIAYSVSENSNFQPNKSDAAFIEHDVSNTHVKNLQNAQPKTIFTSSVGSLKDLSPRKSILPDENIPVQRADVKQKQKISASYPDDLSFSSSSDSHTVMKSTEIADQQSRFCSNFPTSLRTEDHLSLNVYTSLFDEGKNSPLSTDVTRPYSSDHSVTSNNSFYTSDKNTYDTIPKEVWTLEKNEQNSDPNFHKNFLLQPNEFEQFQNFANHLKSEDQNVQLDHKNISAPLPSEIEHKFPAMELLSEVAPKEPPSKAAGNHSFPSDPSNLKDQNPTHITVPSTCSKHTPYSSTKVSEVPVLVVASLYKKVDLKNVIDVGDTVIVPIKTDTLQVEKIGSYDGFPLYVFKPFTKPNIGISHCNTPVPLPGNKAHDSAFQVDSDVTFQKEKDECIKISTKAVEIAGNDVNGCSAFQNNDGTNGKSSGQCNSTNCDPLLFKLSTEKEGKDEAVNPRLSKDIAECLRKLEGKITKIEKQIKHKRNYKSSSYADDSSSSSICVSEANKDETDMNAELFHVKELSVESDKSFEQENFSAVQSKKRHLKKSDIPRESKSSDLKIVQEIFERTLRNHRKKIDRENERLQILRDIIAQHEHSMQKSSLSSDFVSQSECTLSSNSSHMGEMQYIQSIRSMHADKTSSISTSEYDNGHKHMPLKGEKNLTPGCDISNLKTTQTKSLLSRSQQGCSQFQTSRHLETYNPKTVGTQTSIISNSMQRGTGSCRSEKKLNSSTESENSGILNGAQFIPRFVQEISASTGIRGKHIKKPTAWIIPLESADDYCAQPYIPGHKLLEESFKQKCKHVRRRLDARKNFKTCVRSTKQSCYKTYVRSDIERTCIPFGAKEHSLPDGRAVPMLGAFSKSGHEKTLQIDLRKKSSRPQLQVQCCTFDQVLSQLDVFSSSQFFQKRRFYMRKLQFFTTRQTRMLPASKRQQGAAQKLMGEKYRIRSFMFSKIIQRSCIHGRLAWPSSATVVTHANIVKYL